MLMALSAISMTQLLHQRQANHLVSRVCLCRLLSPTLTIIIQH